MTLQIGPSRADMHFESRTFRDQMQHYEHPHLTLDEAYQATYAWFTRHGEAPSATSEPVDGVVEMRSERFLARVRWSRSAINQAAVLALLRVPADGLKRVVFSVTGFTPGAVSLAETQLVALFTFDGAGHANAENSLARLLVSDAPPEETHERMDAPEPEGPETAWPECRGCGTPNRAEAHLCRRCGRPLTSEAAGWEASTVTMAVDDPPQREPTPPQPPDDYTPPEQATPQVGRTTLRCRTCGSDDIELLRR